MKLSKSQEDAVRHNEGPCYVLAGPGSGKTAVITYRIKNLTAEYGVNPSNILVITFTKAAAAEMKRRSCLIMGDEHSHVTFGTFHAVFFMVLKRAYHIESSNVISEEQKYHIMRELIARHPVDYKDEGDIINGLLNEISLVKNSRLQLEHFYSGQCGDEVFRDIFREYDRKLRQNRWIDFDDMLTYTYELFSERPDILQAWQKKYRYILIDEFQDICTLQYDIVRMMAKPEDNLFIVGDDDQSIYRFRGARPQIMLGFPKDYPDAKQILLETNYRCDANIVEASQRLASNNKTRFRKSIRAHKEACCPVSYMRFGDQREETLYLIKKLNDGISRGGSFSDYAVLFRTNTQPRLLMAMLMQYNIPFRVRDHVPNLYEHWIARDIFAYMRIALGSRNRADFLQIMNRPKRYIGRDSLIESEVAFDVWKKMYDRQPWIAERIDKLEADLRAIRRMSPYAAVNYIRKGIGYEEFLQDYAQYRNIDADDLMEILEELHSSAKGYQNYDKWQQHIQDYSAQLKKMAREKKEAAEAVTLATFHSAKGLEFREVFIIDANEGVMPYRKAALDEDIEEERRMFYVGMTRAAEELTICSVQSVNDSQSKISRFVYEAQGKVQKERDSV